MEKETQVRLAGVDKSIDEMRDTVRRIFQDNNTVLSILSKLSDDVNGLKAELSLLKKELSDKDKKAANLGRTNY